jgi:hypothetical protein
VLRTSKDTRLTLSLLVEVRIHVALVGGDYMIRVPSLVKRKQFPYDFCYKGEEGIILSSMGS